MNISSIGFSFEEGAMEMFAPLPSMPKDVLQYLEAPADEAEGPNTSSSDGRGSTSEATPMSSALLGSAASSQMQPASSWLQMAPQLAPSASHNTVSVSAPLVYSGRSQQQQQQKYQWTSSAMWHPAFSQTEASTQLTSKEFKVTASHSTIEKQRRDRINSLIDELRELVPPCASTSKGSDGGDAKRPKHVVLSDTISLLRNLKEKVQQDELERQRLQLIKQQLAASAMMADASAAAAGSASAGMLSSGSIVPMGLAMPECTTLAGAVSQSAQSLLQHSLSGSLASHTAAAATAAVFGPSSCPDLPQAPAHLPSAVGVLVEEGPGSFLVKVNCRDRHGLLSDITQALGSLPLQITRAAITTSDGGAVYDVFEIMVEPSAGQEAVTALDVQFHVHQALYKWKSANPAAAAAADQAGGVAIGKRQRM